MKPCPALWKTPTVNWDGTVTVCCTDIFFRLAIGNVKEKPLKELWKNEKITELRIKHIKQETGDLPVCNECSGMEPDDIEEFKQELITYLTEIGRTDLIRILKI